jgi:hypothetical protein
MWAFQSENDGALPRNYDYISSPRFDHVFRSRVFHRKRGVSQLQSQNVFGGTASFQRARYDARPNTGRPNDKRQAAGLFSLADDRAKHGRQARHFVGRKPRHSRDERPHYLRRWRAIWAANRESLSDGRGKIAEKLLNDDRRVLFLLVFAAAAAAMLIDIPLPIKPRAPVIKMYEEIEKLAAKEGSAMLISMDYDPGSKPELEPMSRAIIRHALRRGIRVVGMTHNLLTGFGRTRSVRRRGSLGKEYGKDFVYLGFKPAAPRWVINMDKTSRRLRLRL